MLPRERVVAVINHEKPDRIPVYAWLKSNLEEPLTERFGSVEAFEDLCEFDFAHLFGKPAVWDFNVKEFREERGGMIEPSTLLELSHGDPDDSTGYEGLKAQIKHHKEDRGRFVYVQTPGIFEALNSVFEIENHLAYLLLHEKELLEIYRRQSEWNRRFAMNCLDIGVDMIHVSDDWGSQRGLMFSPETWWKMIHPFHKVTCDAVKNRGAYLSLHSDGNVSQVLDGIVDLGYDVVHPYQESAGMDLADFKANHINDFTVMGGLDVQSTIGFGKLDFLEKEIRRVLGMFADGGLLFCTTHFVQDHCSMDELVFAFDLVRDLTRA